MTSSIAAIAAELPDLVTITINGQRLRFRWGQIHELGTAAYWIEQTRFAPVPETYRLGDTLGEEVAACILGGHGIPAAIGLAAFAALKEAGLLAPRADRQAVREVLSRPLQIPGRDQLVRYRFATQRANRIAGALNMLDDAVVPDEPRALRDFLLSLPGVGPKTASWVARNRTGATDVAIIDIHVHRAGLAAGFFSPEWKLPRDYGRFEDAFCTVAQLGAVSAAALDACMWDQMQALGKAQSIMLGHAQRPHAAAA